MDKINEYYNELKLGAAPEEMAQRVIAADKAKTKRFCIKKPAIIAAAAAVVLVGGATAAATHILGFNQIFGGIFHSESDALGEKILATAENVQYTVSDENYAIKLNGVTGSPANIILNFEICRADGLPINESKDTFVDVAFLDFKNIEAGGGKYYYEANEAGSIDVEWEQRIKEEDLINGKYICAGPMEFYGAANFEDNGDINMLEFSVSFDYTPTEESMKQLTVADTSQDCIIKCSYFNEQEVFENECDITSLTLTNSVGVLEADLTGIDGSRVPFCNLNDGNDIKLIKTDGTEVLCAFSGGTADDIHVSYTIHYYVDDWYCDQLVVDLNEIEAISINGTVYELS
ncbi:MAG: DUF4179 domain-containing protein [Ruminococcaceae bacterium]|nr:DUF4179 domain-containing protein [Oscillospiraceae bacterium]